METKMVEKENKWKEGRGEDGKFVVGYKGGPGRPKDTKDTLETKIIKKAVKQYLEEYEESLAEALPEISPVLKAKAKEGDMSAIREIHEVIGAHKKSGGSVIVDSNVLILIEKANKILPE